MHFQRLLRGADWHFLAVALLLGLATFAATSLFAASTGEPGATAGDGRVEIDREWLRNTSFHENLETEANAAREGRTVVPGGR